MANFFFNIGKNVLCVTLLLVIKGKKNVTGDLYSKK